MYSKADYISTTCFRCDGIFNANLVQNISVKNSKNMPIFNAVMKHAPLFIGPLYI